VRPRFEPLPIGDADESIREHLARLTRVRGTDTRLLNVFGTLAHHPALLRHWLEFATYLLAESTLEKRLRELVVLRVGWLCRSPYEWGQHVLIGRRVGVRDEDLERLAVGSTAAGWSQHEATALRAAEYMLEQHTLSDALWHELSGLFSRQQILDLVFLVGQYQLVSTALNACRVERDDGLDASTLPFPAQAETD
jgi:alkylhydroperoxidase family enzyme